MSRGCLSRRIYILILVLVQISVVLYVLLLQNENISGKGRDANHVKFIGTSDRALNVQFDGNGGDKIVLNGVKVDNLFKNFNSSLCFKDGTDLKVMKNKNIVWKCFCLKGWHGRDCGQPETIWRAGLKTKKIFNPTLRKITRRVIYLIEFEQIYQNFIEITLNELAKVVDLFVLVKPASNTISKQLTTDFGKKLLILNKSDEFWTILNSLVHLKDDDLIFFNKPYEIPNADAINFLKIYNAFPDPVIFRFHYSVYGYFWSHPSKTILSSPAATLKYIYSLKNNIYELKNALEKSDFIIGDLNQNGGHYCEFCFHPYEIIQEITRSKFDLNDSKYKKIDETVIETFIENGIYIDGKTNLIRAHSSNDYYAPQFTLNHNKFDYLIKNLYIKLDYY